MSQFDRALLTGLELLPSSFNLSHDSHNFATEILPVVILRRQDDRSEAIAARVNICGRIR